MAAATLGAVRKVFEQARGPAGGDGELLTRYRSGRDPDAFGSLVRRHGPMVLGVCRRVLRDTHAADDAFQATFLVLARKAGAVRPPDRLAPWLYGVAYRTALKARGRAFRRRQVEADYATRAADRSAPPAADAADLLPLIDEQVSALPEKYRDPLVLCGVQGLNKAEAATRLGLPEGTVSSRLARAREMLRDRLTRRGVAVPAAGFAAVLTADTLQAAVPPALAGSAAATAVGSAAAPAAVLTLSHEVLRSMTLFNLKVFGAIAVSVSLAGGGFGLVATGADEQKPAAEKPAAKPEKPGGNNQNNQNDDGQKNQKNDGQRNQNDDGQKNQKNDGQKPGRKQFKVAGKVAGVDVTNNSLAVARQRESGIVEEFFKLAADAKLFVDGKPAGLKDVPRDSTAALVLLAGTKDGERPEILEARVTGASVTGLISKVEAGAVTVGVADVGDKVVKLTADTKVTVDGKEAKAADLKAGDKVTVTLTAKGDAALSVSRGTGGKDGGEKPAKPDGGKPDGGKVPAGKPVAAVDPVAGTITLAVKTDGGGAPVVRVAAGAKVFVDGREAKLADVPKGAVVTFGGLKDGAKEVGEVRAAGETFTGTVRQVDLATVTVNVKGEKGKGGDRVLKLADGGTVTAGGKDVKLTDLKEGDVVTVTLTADASAALTVVAGPTKAGGDAPKPEKEDE
ncbi:MAG: hypothetical protein C0501_15600 [Isosphaera sp.]|nr:hypothetical protein [Isosphaera sp.]